MVGSNRLPVLKSLKLGYFPFQELESAQEAFVHLLGQLKPECKSQFLDWVHVEYSFSSKSECTAVLNDGLDEISEEPGKA